MPVARSTQPLRILYVLSKLEARWTGGIGRVTSAMAMALAARGHEVHMAGPARDTEPPGDLAGVVMHPWRATLPRSAQFLALRRTLREIRPDVVHFHSALPHSALILPMTWFERGPDRPLVVCTPHTGSRWENPGHSGNRGLRAADLVVATSEWTRGHVLSRGVREDRIDVNPSGVDPPVSRLRGAEEPMILALGKLTQRKGMDLLLEAFIRVSADFPEWRLVVGGRGDQLRDLRARAGSTGVPAFFPGFVTGDEKTSLLASAAIGVVPSRRDMIPGALLELQSHGLPVIAADTGGIAEACDDGRAALLVPAGNVGGLAEAMARLMSDPALRARLAWGAFSASTLRTWPRLAHRLEKIYRRHLVRLAPCAISGRVEESALQR